MTEYYIFEGNMENLRKKVKRIQNKCKKYNCDFHYAEVGEEIKEVKDENGNKHNCKFIKVEAEGTAIINNWVFVSVIEHKDKGNIFRKAAYDTEIPERYRECSPYCEHCKQIRSRKDTYIVYNTETNEFKQVGKSCLKDYTNGLSVEHASLSASFASIFEEEKEYHGGGFGSCTTYYNTEEVLKYAAETIRIFGYYKKNNEQDKIPTVTRLCDVMTIKGDYHQRMESKERYWYEDILEKREINTNSLECITSVYNALKWLYNQKEDNDYIHNLKVLTSDEYCKEKDFSMLISLLPCYAKAEDKIKQHDKAKAESNHVGKVGDKLTVHVSSWKRVASYETEWGVCAIYNFIDNYGNVFIWKTSTYLEDKDIETITGKVKSHNEYRGIKQTELTRCKVSYKVMYKERAEYVSNDFDDLNLIFE